MTRVPRFVDHHLDDALVRERSEDHLAELAVELLAEARRANVARVVELLSSPIADQATSASGVASMMEAA